MPKLTCIRGLDIGKLPEDSARTEPFMGHLRAKSLRREFKARVELTIGINARQRPENG